eukprot:2679039-Amphidinium_carterae.1
MRFSSNYTSTDIRCQPCSAILKSNGLQNLSKPTGSTIFGGKYAYICHSLCGIDNVPFVTSWFEWLARSGLGVGCYQDNGGSAYCAHECIADENGGGCTLLNPEVVQVSISPPTCTEVYQGTPRLKKEHTQISRRGPSRES